MSYNITLTKSNSQSYTSALKKAHEMIYHDGYVWAYLVEGTYTHNPAKIDATSLSSYTGVSGTLTNNHTSMVFAKGYFWYPKSAMTTNIRRTLPADLTTTDYAAGFNVSNEFLYYDSTTEIIFIGTSAGFATMDISDVDNPAFTEYDINSNIAGTDFSFFHACNGDGTYVYITANDATSGEYGIIKVKASDPAHDGGTGWAYALYDFPTNITDDMAYYDGYLYPANDPATGHDTIMIKVDTSDLSEVKRVTLSTANAIGCYGTWENEGLIFTAITTSPSKIQIYDTDLVLLHTHTFSTGYDIPNEIIFNDNKMWVSFWGTTNLVIQELDLVIEELPMAWSSTTLSTTTSLKKYENEINKLLESSGTEYLSDGVNIAVSSANTSSIDAHGGMIEIICKVATEVTIKDTKSLTITMQDSADDTTFAAITTGGIQYTNTVSEDTTIAANTELFRYVVPTDGVEDYIRCVITSDATNSGTLDIYSNSKWANKISIAKDKIKNMLETWLVDRGYKDYPDYDSDEVLIDLIANPSTFAVASDYLTLHYIFRDLGLKSGEDSIWYDKSKTYLQDFKEEFNEAVRRITLDIDQDGSADTDAPENWTPKLIV